tara:strand:- start:64 stop:345 length:282 start_codon:yes stop_codon:yes gene_type:complete
MILQLSHNRFTETLTFMARRFPCFYPPKQQIIRQQALRPIFKNFSKSKSIDDLPKNLQRKNPDSFEEPRIYTDFQQQVSIFGPSGVTATVCSK